MTRLRAALVTVCSAIASLALMSSAQAQQFIYGNSAGNGLYKIDKTTGIVAAQCQQSKGNGRGIVVVANVVYFTVANSGNVYKTNFTSCSDDGIAFAVPGSSGLSTIAFDGTNFWIGDYTGTNAAYYVSPTGTLITTIHLSQCTGFCDGLEFFNGKLISNKADRPPTGYDVYSTTGTLLQPDFIPGAPTQPYDKTGIAFDGANFYVSDIANQNLQVFNGTTGAFIQTVHITGMNFSTAIEDLSADYAIVLGPPPAPPGATVIPTMSEWGLAAMSLLLAVSAFFVIRRRS